MLNEKIVGKEFVEKNGQIYFELLEILLAQVEFEKSCFSMIFSRNFYFFLIKNLIFLENKI